MTQSFIFALALMHGFLFIYHQFNRMSTSVHDEASFYDFTEQKKPKIMVKRFPKDFFEASVSLRLRNSIDLGQKCETGRKTPSFGKKRPLQLSIRRQAVTALNDYDNPEKDNELIKDIIYSSRNIRKLRKKSLQLKINPFQKEFKVFNTQLPSINHRKCPRF